MQSIARISLRALYCDVALKSIINIMQAEFQSVLGFCTSRSSSSSSSSNGISSSLNNAINRSGAKDDVMDGLKSFNSAPKNITENNQLKGLCDFDCNILHKDMITDKDRTSKTASDLGITYFVVPGSNLLESRKILYLATVENGVTLIGTAGVHPYSAAKDVLSDITLAELNSMVSKKNCFAVGECGLDYSEGFPDKAPQIEWFRSQISLAVRYSKPLYLHSRDAEDDFLSVLGEFGFGENIQPMVPGCVHCFTGTTEELQRYVNCGFYIGLTGFIMKMDDEKLLLWLQMITLDKLVIETDAPYMGFKGCRSTEVNDRKRTYPNVPASLLKVLDRVCAVSGWSAAEVISRTTSNAINGFLRLPIEDK